MKVLIVGGGAREHALAWKIAQSPRAEKIFCAPGNAGIREIADCVDIKAEDVAGLARFARRQGVDLTVVGPEAPLAAGIVDRFEKEGLRIFGPRRSGAELEGSKVFCKQLLRRSGIPTAEYQVFESAVRAREYIAERGTPIVLKADGLAAGKGVLVCRTDEEADAAVERLLVKREFAEAGKRVVIEECLYGEETSIMALSDGRTIVPLLPSQDHKAVFDADKGPNTGGMGAYAPAPVVTKPVMDAIIKDVLVPTVHALNRDARPYKGVLYAGLMITDEGPRVLEYNVRFGDPEAEPILMLLKSDLVELMEATIDGRLDEINVEWHDGAAVSVVMASGGYPGPYEKGFPITGIEDARLLGDVAVFHAGTAPDKSGRPTSAGGRVLAVTARGADIQAAIDRAYLAVGKISFKGAHFRRDIGHKATRRLQPV